MTPKLSSCRCCHGSVSEEARVCPHCGQPDPVISGWEVEARNLVARGQPIEAIKLVREKTGLGLAEAKGLVDRWRS